MSPSGKATGPNDSPPEEIEQARKIAADLGISLEDLAKDAATKKERIKNLDSRISFITSRYPGQSSDII